MTNNSVVAKQASGGWGQVNAALQPKLSLLARLHHPALPSTNHL
jgi:hypothetical protein